MTSKTTKNQQEESIYNLIPRAEVRPVRGARYESKFKPDVVESWKEVKQDHRTMGYAEEPLPDPKNFLKKNQNTTKEPKIRSAPVSRDSHPRRPPVPRAQDAPKMAMKTEKNFIQSNALDAAMAVPKKPQRNIVDDRFGDKFSIDPSGLAPKYVMKKDFGEVPVYIKTRRKDIEKAKEEYQSYVSEYFRHGAMREMDDQERQTILNSLKQQWQEIHHEFQTLSVQIDTIPKRTHKERLEHQMKLLEKDIDLLAKHQVIYIAD